MPKTKTILITTRSHEIYIVREVRKDDEAVASECRRPVEKAPVGKARGKVIKCPSPKNGEPERG